MHNHGRDTDTENLPIIYGFDPADTEAGKPLRSKNENKYDAFTQLISRFDRDDNTDIASIDLSNEYAITVNYRNGLMFKMGNWNDVEYKLDLAREAMNDESVKGKKGYLMMIGSHVCSFRPSGETSEDTTSAVSTDANGLPVTTSTATTTTTAADTGYSGGGDYDDSQYDGGWQDDSQYYGGDEYGGDDYSDDYSDDYYGNQDWNYEQ